jgi:hypothetical protein
MAQLYEAREKAGSARAVGVIGVKVRNHIHTWSEVANLQGLVGRADKIGCGLISHQQAKGIVLRG